MVGPARSDQRKYLWGDGLPRNMALLAALMAALTALVDLMFRARAKALLDHGAQTALFGGEGLFFARLAGLGTSAVEDESKGRPA